jgi:hypothetical protein
MLLIAGVLEKVKALEVRLLLRSAGLEIIGISLTQYFSCEDTLLRSRKFWLVMVLDHYLLPIYARKDQVSLKRQLVLRPG